MQNEPYGALAHFGMCQPQVYCKKGFTKDNIPYPPIDVNRTMAQSIEDATDEIHPYFDLDRIISKKDVFTHTPLRTQYLIAIYLQSHWR